MKKIIYICLFLTYFLTASEKVDLHQNATAGTGIDGEGFVYRSYKQDGYIEYIGEFAHRDGHVLSRIGFDIGRYLVVNYNENIDFGVKYSYGIMARDNATMFILPKAYSVPEALFRIRLA